MKITSSTVLGCEIMKSTWPSICLVLSSSFCHLCPSISDRYREWINFIFLCKYMFLCVSTEISLSGNLLQASENDSEVTFGHNSGEHTIVNQINLLQGSFHIKQINIRFFSAGCFVFTVHACKEQCYPLVQSHYFRGQRSCVSSSKATDTADISPSFTLVHLPSLLPPTPTHIQLVSIKLLLTLWSEIKQRIHTVTAASMLRWHALTSTLFIIN